MSHFHCNTMEYARFLERCDLIRTVYTQHYKNSYIKMSGSESRGQEEAACMRDIRPMRPLQQVIYMDGSSKILKRCGLAAITAIA